MEKIKDLPNEIQNKIFYYLEHPIATIFKNEFTIELFKVLNLLLCLVNQTQGNVH